MARVIGRPGLLVAAAGAVATLCLAGSARAQNYVQYQCAGGAHFELALFPEDRAAFIQIDGKSLRLPKFVSVTGTRYRRDGITVWVKGNRATLRRAGKRIECTRQ